MTIFLLCGWNERKKERKKEKNYLTFWHPHLYFYLFLMMRDGFKLLILSIVCFLIHSIKTLMN
jgi:fumarate reductase subunit C